MIPVILPASANCREPFIGSPNAGKRSAIIYSIIVSCQRHGIDPLGYMTDLLHRLPNISHQEDLDPLLPANWKEA